MPDAVLPTVRKIMLDVDGVETPVTSLEMYERQHRTNGKSRLLIAASPAKPDLFRELAERLAEPLYLLYVLHTPRGEGLAGRYQSPPLESGQVDDFLRSFGPYLSGDARHDIWVYSASEGRTLIWDRHDLIYCEGEPLEDMTAVLEANVYQLGMAPRSGAAPHIHYYRASFDRDAVAVLARFQWSRSDLQPEDEQ